MNTYLRSCFGTLLGLVLMVRLVSATPFVVETPREFTAAADFDGDGLLDAVIVDKTSGHFRLGFTDTNGTAWHAARSAGMSDITGFGIGPLLLAEPGAGALPNAFVRDDLTFANPTANRIQILNADRLGGSIASAVHPTGIGASLVVPARTTPGLAPLLDLVAGSSLNEPSSPHRVGLLANLAGTFSNQVNVVTAGRTERGNRLNPRTNSPPTYVAWLVRLAGESQFQLHNVGAGTFVLDASVTGLDRSAEYAFGRFGGNPLGNLVVFQPGGTNFSDYRFAEPAPGNFDLPPVPTRQFGFGTNRLSGLQVIDGPSGHRLLAVLNDGALASVYDYDGLVAPRLVASGNAPAGERFTSAIGGNGAGFQLLSGNGGISLTATPQSWNGSNYVAGSSIPLPPVERDSLNATVAQFQFEPFVSPQSQLLGFTRAGDWASAPAFSNSGGGPIVQVLAEEFRSATNGLGNGVRRSAGPQLPTATHALASQYLESISLATLSQPVGELVANVTISPAAGTYRDGVCFQLSSSRTNDLLFYRLNGGDWTRFSSAVPLYQATTVEFYGEAAGPQRRSAIGSARYEFSTPSLEIDSDNDGVPDFVEIARGLDPKGGRDSDGDGFSDLDELLSGTDPNNRSRYPGAGHDPVTPLQAIRLNVVPLPHALPLPGWGVATGTVIHTRTLQGAVLGELPASKDTNLAPAVALLTRASAQFEFTLNAGSLVSVATPESYFASPERSNAVAPSGRELIALVSLPKAVEIDVPFRPVSQSIFRQADEWIAAAQTFLATNPAPLLRVEPQPVDVLIAALFEHKLDEIIPATLWARTNPITCFPFRSQDSGRTNPPLDVLTRLMSPLRSNTWLLPDLLAEIDDGARNLSDSNVVALRLLTAGIYGINTFSNNVVQTNGIRPMTYGPLLDELRFLLEKGTLSSNYLALAADLPPTLIAQAVTGARIVLSNATARPRVTLELVAGVEAFEGDCIRLSTASNTPVALVDRYQRPFDLRAAFEVAPGSRIRVLGFDDLPPGTCAPRVLEVIALSLVDLPPANGPDRDADGMADAWELLFLGGTLAINGTSDSDGDGFNNRREFLGGTDPLNPLAFPGGPPDASDMAAGGIEATPEGDATLEESADGDLSVTTDGDGADGVTLDGGDSGGVSIEFADDGSTNAPALDTKSDLSGTLTARLRVTGRLGAATNRPLVDVTLVRTNHSLFLSADTSFTGAASNHFLFLGRGGVLLGSVSLPRATALEIRAVAPAGARATLGAKGAGQAVSFARNLVRATAAGMTQFANNLVTHTAKGVVAFATELASGNSDESGDESGDDSEADEDSGDSDESAEDFTTWPKWVVLPNGTRVSNIVAVVTLPADSTAGVTGIQRLSLTTPDAAQITLRHAGLLNDSVAYAALPGNRVRGVPGPDGQFSFGCSNPTLVGPGTVAKGAPTLAGLKLRRAFDLNRALEQFDAARTGAQAPRDPNGLYSALAAIEALPDFAFGRPVALSNALQVVLQGTASELGVLGLPRRPARVNFGLQPTPTNGIARLVFSADGIRVRRHHLILIDTDGAEVCEFTLEPGALGTVSGAGAATALGIDLPPLRTALRRTGGVSPARRQPILHRHCVAPAHRTPAAARVRGRPSRREPDCARVRSRRRGTDRGAQARLG
jgi:hypothetical protein